MGCCRVCCPALVWLCIQAQVCVLPPFCSQRMSGCLFVKKLFPGQGQLLRVWKESDHDNYTHGQQTTQHSNTYNRQQMLSSLGVVMQGCTVHVLLGISLRQWQLYHPSAGTVAASKIGGLASAQSMSELLNAK